MAKNDPLRTVRSALQMVAIVMSMLLLADGSFAATIAPTNSPNCQIIISGEILPGDFAAFTATADILFHGTHNRDSRVCLNSPGGNVWEGVRFARYFFENGIGTVIDDGQECYSVCAIMFMTGFTNEGEEQFINRKLHVRGVLGFHRPFLRVQSDKQVESPELAAAYDAALQSALDLIQVANTQGPIGNSPIMKSDLMERMLAHIGKQLFLIDTVDKAGRWEIELLGATYPKALTEERAYYACANSLQWQSATTKGDITYTGKSKPVNRIKTKDGSTAFDVNLSRIYGDFAVTRCIISTDGDGVVGCGINELTGVSLGQWPCTTDTYAKRSSALNRLAVFDPGTDIRQLGGAVSASRCVVLEHGAKVDDEPCTLRRGETLAGGGAATIYAWRSGGKTVVVQFPDHYEINGVATEQAKNVELGLCYFNSKTNRTFCVSQ